MAGDVHGAEAQEEPRAQEDGQPQVSGQLDYERAIGERDARIAELEAQVAEAAKSAEAAEGLRAQIAELKAQGESDRVDFALRLAGTRNLKAARAVLADHGGDVEALVAAEPWLFPQPAGASQLTSHESGTTGVEPAGAAGGSDERDLRRWERIAGLTDEEEAWRHDWGLPLNGCYRLVSGHLAVAQSTSGRSLLHNDAGALTTSPNVDERKRVCFYVYPVYGSDGEPSDYEVIVGAMGEPSRQRFAGVPRAGLPASQRS